MAKHTPGPWHAVPNLSDTQWRVEAPDGGICVPCYGRDDHLLTGANARLIAAAPDLLDGLKRALDWLASYPGNGASGAYDEARTAIAKAEGRNAS